MTIICPKCNTNHFIAKEKSIHTGLYCYDCGRWIKRLNKEEKQTLLEYGVKIERDYKK